MEKVGQAAANVKLVGPALTRTFIDRDQSLLVACPPGCVRGKTYFDTNTLCAWLHDRGWPATVETLRARLRYRVCGERPAEVRLVTKLWTFRLATLPGMPPSGRS